MTAHQHKMTLHDLRQLRPMPPAGGRVPALHLSGSDAVLLRLACSELSLLACRRATGAMITSALLRDIDACVAAVEERCAALRGSSESTRPPALMDGDVSDAAANTGGSSAVLLPPSCSAQPLLDKLHCAGSVEALAGAAQQPPIIVPVEITLVPPSVRSLSRRRPCGRRRRP